MPVVSENPSKVQPEKAAYYPLKLPNKLRKNLERLRAIRASSSLNALIVEILDSEVTNNAKAIAKIRELQAK